jgi:RimJ/RimL family protein N-acetyltransferase
MSAAAHNREPGDSAPAHLNWTPPAPLPCEVHTPRLIIRPFAAGDAPELFRIVNADREHLKPFVPWSHHDHRSLERTASYCADMARRTIEPGDATDLGVSVAVIERDSGELVGGQGFHAVRPEIAACEFGYWLRADRVGRGYATESSRHWLSRLFLHVSEGGFGFARVKAVCSDRNTASVRLLDRIGLRREVHQRRGCFVPEVGITDLIAWGVLA